METVIVRAYAKINLALDVLGLRPDGYHDLRMVMQTLRLHDSLLIKKVDKYPFKMVCDQDKLPTDERNLVHKAIIFLKREYDIKQGVFVSLRKRIPLSAGLAGGSSDCAAALIGMNRLFALGIPSLRLREIGARFGADVPFCLMGGTALAEGIGDRLTPLPPHPRVWVLLAHPSAPVSTPAIFKQYDLSPSGAPPDIPALCKALQDRHLPGIAACFGNRLTGITARLHPEIETLIRLMRRHGALNAAMTGTGPTVFGYFDDKKTALSAMDAIRTMCPLIHDVYVTGVCNDPYGMKGEYHECM